MQYGETLIWKNVTTIPAPTLSVGEVHLWWVPLVIDQQRVADFLPLLSEKQREKMQRLPTQEKRDRYVAGRGFLHQLLCAYLDIDKPELRFGPYGKPALKNQKQPLQFNFSDTCGCGLFAFSLEAEIGVDLESTARHGRFQQIIDRRFSPDEKTIIDGQNAEQFLACWTRKEAYGKAMGVGLNYPLGQHVLCDSLTQNMSLSPDGKWCLQQLAIKHDEQEFIACLASYGHQQKTLKAFKLLTI